MFHVILSRGCKQMTPSHMFHVTVARLGSDEWITLPLWQIFITAYVILVGRKWLDGICHPYGQRSFWHIDWRELEFSAGTARYLSHNRNPLFFCHLESFLPPRNKSSCAFSANWKQKATLLSRKSYLLSVKATSLLPNKFYVASKLLILKYGTLLLIMQVLETFNSNMCKCCNWLNFCK